MLYGKSIFHNMYRRSSLSSLCQFKALNVVNRRLPAGIIFFDAGDKSLHDMYGWRFPVSFVSI